MGYILMALGSIVLLSIVAALPMMALDLFKKAGVDRFTVLFAIAVSAFSLAVLIGMVLLWRESIQTGCFAGCLPWEEPYL